MKTELMEVAQRIRGLREMMNITREELADYVGIDYKTYREYENGDQDFGFTFLYKCAERFGVDIVELLTGDCPKLSAYTVVKAGEGLDIKRRQSFVYEHLAYKFQHKMAEPFLVTAPYNPEEQDKEISLSRHDGQEFDYILSGKLKVQVGTHIEILNPGDCIYYNSAIGHGMIAIDGEDCKFLAVVMHYKMNESEVDKDA